jgi:hypothetical protein
MLTRAPCRKNYSARSTRCPAKWKVMEGFLKAVALSSVIYVSIEFFAGFFEMDSAHLLAGFALFLACRSDLRIDELEEKK